MSITFAYPVRDGRTGHGRGRLGGYRIDIPGRRALPAVTACRSVAARPRGQLGLLHPDAGTGAKAMKNTHAWAPTPRP